MMLSVAKRVCCLFKEELTTLRSHHTKMQIAPLQKSALEERCILVDNFDKVIGSASKKHCHLIAKDGSIPLHRAFSVFLFNSKGDLLIQKRSANKITFPGFYTNTCCSHPLAEIEGETEEKDALGIRRAAQRRLGYELGIPSKEVAINDFQYLTRIHYQAAGCNIWGEHEIDYVLFLKIKKVTLDPNPDEISEIQWIQRADVSDFIKSIDSPLTPWFKLILENQLLEWWDNLDSLHKYQEHSKIQRFKKF